MTARTWIEAGGRLRGIPHWDAPFRSRRGASRIARSLHANPSRKYNLPRRPLCTPFSAGKVILGWLSISNSSRTNSWPDSRLLDIVDDPPPRIYRSPGTILFLIASLSVAALQEFCANLCYRFWDAWDTRDSRINKLRAINIRLRFRWHCAIFRTAPATS
jgi:hypothetical protein